tara:strand:+ start:91 stop:441 length:351 start_codon:yes stop_codon:yes gene_type:complete
MINTNKKDTMETKEQALYLTHINYKGKKIKLPFKILSTTARDETREVQATNGLSQQSTTLPMFARAVYEHILVAELQANMEDKKFGRGGSYKWDKVRAGLDWFRRYFAKQYMVLLD